MKLFGFVGAGNMGYPMLRGAIKAFGSDKVIYTDASTKRLDYVKNETGLDYITNNKEVINQAKYILLAVKPQYFDIVFKDIKEYLTKEHIVIYLSPGITILDMKESLGSDIRIVRAMPNTPAMVNEGMTAICYSCDSYTEDEKSTLDTFFQSFGKYEVLEERLMNAIVCASGSSPAYVYMFIEALADSAVKYGIPRDKAYKFVAQTVIGSAKMVLETGEHPGALKDMVCSPGGTTIEGVAALEEFGFRNAIMKASDACYNKANRMKDK